ncbi:molybdate ABC transporter substrate-binding protein [Virgibacillus halodenitrificans]|uniref:Molybdate ABC transporter substrate-binding protein n=1 Tax=Virgibacillus halodenitrificans TaxID=1482 RepID=A0AAC9J6T0_VIRHA|nr:molybdate ABC transporter substrate-binding protein [Virgibacillus halodenitrificans]APC49964.1 molybdate ABC transporter substrate-binding protein [Virgibacillus halodenitrificans]MCJ0932120.1 molybdate ABC transporter substrate-binding protein [Virgibacillus halodenitrificans]
MRRISLLLLIIFSIVLLNACGNSDNSSLEQEKNNKKESESLTVSAAISLTDALDEIKELYENDHDVNLTFNLGGSGKLAQQIQHGAPADVFISANQDWMDKLEKEKLIFPDTRKDVAGNSLVLITHKDTDINYHSVEEISGKDIGQVAIGNPDSVPAGEYAEQALQKLNKWEEFESQMVLGKDVRQVLTYVETKNAEIGFVYKSDALTSSKVKILTTLAPETHDPIIYPIAVLKETKHTEAAKSFIQFMESKEAQQILEKYGFKK